MGVLQSSLIWPVSRHQRQGMEEEEGKGASKLIQVIPGMMSESLKGGMLGIRR